MRAARKNIKCIHALQAAATTALGAISIENAFFSASHLFRKPLHTSNAPLLSTLSVQAVLPGARGCWTVNTGHSGKSRASTVVRSSGCGGLRFYQAGSGVQWRLCYS